MNSTNTTHTPFESKFLLSDEEVRNRGIKASDVELFRRFYYTKSFGIGKWCGPESTLTFRTRTIDLSYQEAQSILAIHRWHTHNQRYQSEKNIEEQVAKLREAEKSWDEQDEDELDRKDYSDLYESLLNPKMDTQTEEQKQQFNEHIQIMRKLEERIANFLSQLEMTSDGKRIGVFVKLDTRSPKDVPVYDFQNPVIRRKVVKAIKKLLAEHKTEVESDVKRLEHYVSLGFIIGSNSFLRIEYPSQVMYLLLRSSRIYEDLSKMSEFPESEFNSQLNFRDWDDCVLQRPEYEFRGFVHQRKLTAVTQYFSFLYFPHLVQERKELEQILQDFYYETIIKENVLPEHESYVIDFFIDNRDKSKKAKVFIIELNPFHQGAGAGLFSWKENRELFLNGPFTMRIVDSEMEDPLDVLPPFFQKLFLEFFNPSHLAQRQQKQRQLEAQQRQQHQQQQEEGQNDEEESSWSCILC